MPSSTTLHWMGVTLPETLKPSERETRDRLADAAYRADWETVLSILSRRRDLANATRLGGASLYAPLHQAAYHNAPAEVVEALIGLGAWRTLRDRNGQRPVDIAREKGHQDLLALLEPEIKRPIPAETVQAIQQNFHTIILGRAQQLVAEHNLRLPELDPLLEYEDCTGLFPIPGMYGGFRYWLEERWESVLLISESWSRVVGGSGERHIVTPYGFTLADQGFV